MTDTIRIFSFVGSFAGENSHTKRASDMLADAVKEKAADKGMHVSYECITADQIRVDYCRSCTACFKEGLCPLDSHDDMGMLKEKFLGADILFLCTPIYMWEMSGICKSVIDRIAYWSHRFELAGKAGVTVASTDLSIMPDFSERFGAILGTTGLAVVNGITVRKYGSPNLRDADEMKALMGETAEKLLDAVSDPSSYITQKQDLQWKTTMANTRRMQRLKELTGIEPWEEAKVCADRGMTECSTLAEYIVKVNKKGRSGK